MRNQAVARNYVQNNAEVINFPNNATKKKKSILKRIKWNNVAKLVLFIIVATAMVTIIDGRMNQMAEERASLENAKTVEIYVEEGDTLWEIADRNEFVGVDIRDVIYKIEKLNNLESVSIKAGQKLIVPVPSK
jgi:nucleoid-associated protein YgaU